MHRKSGNGMLSFFLMKRKRFQFAIKVRDQETSAVHHLAIIFYSWKLMSSRWLWSILSFIHISLKGHMFSKLLNHLYSLPVFYQIMHFSFVDIIYSWPIFEFANIFHETGHDTKTRFCILAWVIGPSWKRISQTTLIQTNLFLVKTMFFRSHQNLLLNSRHFSLIP